MLVLEIEFLTGRYVSTEYNDYDVAEWPPHPARLFSALVAVHHEDPADEKDVRKEREALDWLSGQPAPSIYASDAARRTVSDIFVPTNDKSVNPRVSYVVNELIDAERRGDARAAKAKRELLKKLTAEALSPIPNAGKEVRKRALCVLPSATDRKQARKFPSVFPYDPIVHLLWNVKPPQSVRRALDALAARVTRLGHPSSLVRLAWIDAPRTATWIPDPYAEHTLRWVKEPRRDQEGNVIAGTGQLAALKDAFEFHGGTANRVLPSVPVNYRRVDDTEPTTIAPRSNTFGSDWIVFELLGSKRLPIVRAVDAALALRGAVLRQAHQRLCGCDLWNERTPVPSATEARACYEKLPATLSGHRGDGSPTRRSHVAFVALPFVGFPHADGSILGVAAILPRGLVGEERRAVLLALGGVGKLTLIPGLAFDVRRITEPQPHLRTSDPFLWCCEGVVWGTVTPILLDRFPGNLRSRNADAALKAEQEAEEAIMAACERIGLPRPRAVSLTTPCFRGSVAAELFRRRDRSGLPPRVRVHALIDFGRAVRGPVLLGAGRYLGLGLCRPLLEGRRS